MATYRINSECGGATIAAESLDQAKVLYSESYYYDFEAIEDYPGSWYWIEEDGVRVEDHTECMP